MMNSTTSVFYPSSTMLSRLFTGNVSVYRSRKSKSVKWKKEKRIFVKEQKKVKLKDLMSWLNKKCLWTDVGVTDSAINAPQNKEEQWQNQRLFFVF